MARTEKKLSARYVETVRTPGRHSDGGGLYLNVSKTGAKSWLFMWKRQGKRREMGLGSATGQGNVAAVSLATARKKAEQVRQILSEGGDPFAVRNSQTQRTFGEAADEFLANNEAAWRNSKHRAQWKMTLTEYCAGMRKVPIDKVNTEHVLSVLQPIWTTKAETASRLRGRVERVLDFAKARGWRSGDNPARWRGHLKSILPPRQKLTRGHHKAMPFADVPQFMVRLRDHDGLSARALELCILTATRTSETLKAEWSEINLDAGLWIVPGHRTKSGNEHRIPLSSQAVQLLQDVYAVRDSDFVFPGAKRGRPLSGMSMLMMLRRRGTDCTVHGFRSSFRDWCAECTSFPREVVELGLAHVVGDATERAYRRGDVLEKRRALMQAWADYCTGAETSRVVQLHR